MFNIKCWRPNHHYYSVNIKGKRHITRRTHNRLFTGVWVWGRSLFHMMLRFKVRLVVLSPLGWQSLVVLLIHRLTDTYVFSLMDYEDSVVSSMDWKKTMFSHLWIERRLCSLIHGLKEDYVLPFLDWKKTMFSHPWIERRRSSLIHGLKVDYVLSSTGLRSSLILSSIRLKEA